ncbi:MAG: NfeD family protein [Bacteroidales bacterium]|nr:NfeD family protein [Bacteroidales bacterium]
MIELFKYSFSLSNIIPSILLVLILVYWGTVFIGLLDLNSFDFDIDTDVDIDVDVDVDVDIDTHIDIDTHVETGSDFDMHSEVDASGGHIGEPNFFIKSLLYFNIGKMPFMAFLSILSLPLWSITILTNYYLGIENFFISILLFIPVFFVSMFLAKFLSNPIAKMFQKIDAHSGVAEKFHGKTALVRITLSEDSDGQIEIVRNGATAYLTARSTKGTIEAGQEVLIIDYLKEEKYYIVEPYN